MGFFSDLFGKKTCCLCGAECGAMKREKIKNKEYVCNECKRKCSSFVRISEMDKETVQEHIAFMEKREKIYQEILLNSKVQRFESKKKDKGFYFYDDHGFVVIENKKAGVPKENHEVIRYDEIDSYEIYTEMNEPTEAGKPKTFKEDGVLIRLVNSKPGVQLSSDTGFINGRSADTFAPAENLTLAEVVKLAACVRQKTEEGAVTLTNASGTWYLSYVAYALEHGMLPAGARWTDADFRRAATRAETMAVFANAAV